MASRKTDIYDLAHSYGYELKRKRTHLIWQHVITGFVAVTSSTASDKHALNQAERVFRKGALA
jgi:hypothetical protein